MKILVCSVPKSGTYLLSNFLKELNIVDSRFHLNDNEYSDYSNATLSQGRKYPEKYRIELPFSDAVKKIEDNNFAVGHFSTNQKQFLGGFKTIFLYRNLIDCTISFGVWTAKTERWKNFESSGEWRQTIDKPNFICNFLNVHMDSVFSLFNKTVAWIDEEGVLKVNFEKLTGKLGKDAQVDEFDKIIKHLGIELTPRQLESKIANCLNKASLTKITSKKDYTYYQTKHFFGLYKKSKIQDLNRKLGFNQKNGFFKNIFNSKTKLSFYDKYWKQNKKSNTGWHYGINIVDNLIEHYQFTSILDAGCGSGDVVRYLLEKGYDAKGIELSGEVLKSHSPDLLRKGIVQQGSLLKLPFPDDSFDVVFSSEVLEHIPEEDICFVARELNRVAKKFVFMTISLRPSSSFNYYHITLKSRDWWEGHFLDLGLQKDNRIIDVLQKKLEGGTVKEILEKGPTKSHIHEMEWFIENQPYDFFGELEPWYFIFKKDDQ